jgi:hypothetical protein
VTTKELRYWRLSTYSTDIKIELYLLVADPLPLDRSPLIPDLHYRSIINWSNQGCVRRERSAISLRFHRSQRWLCTAINKRVSSISPHLDGHFRIRDTEENKTRRNEIRNIPAELSHRAKSGRTEWKEIRHVVSGVLGLNGMRAFDFIRRNESLLAQWSEAVIRARDDEPSIHLNSNVWPVS